MIDAPYIYQRQLPSGASFYVVPTAHRSLVALELGLPSGAIAESRPGLAALLACAFSRPAKGSSAHQALTDLECLGAEMVIQATWNCLSFSLQILHTDLVHALDALHRLLLTPPLDTDTLSRIRSSHIALVEEARNDGGLVADLVLARMLGNPFVAEDAIALGNVSAITGIDVGDLRLCAEASVTTAGLCVAAVGAVGPDDIDGISDRLLAQWPNHHSPPRRHLPVLGTNSAVVHSVSPLVHIGFAIDLMPLIDRPTYWATVLALMLEEQLIQRLRIEESLVYEVHVIATKSALIIRAATEPALTWQVRTGIRSVLDRLSVVPSNKLAHAARRALHVEAMLTESTCEIASVMLRDFAFRPSDVCEPSTAWQTRWSWLRGMVQNSNHFSMPILPPDAWCQVIVGPILKADYTADGGELIPLDALL